MTRAALEENDTALLLAVIGDIARSKGMAQIAKELNLARESLCRSLSQDSNPSFDTVAKVLDNLGFQLSVRQKQQMDFSMKRGFLPVQLSECFKCYSLTDDKDLLNLSYPGFKVQNIF